MQPESNDQSAQNQEEPIVSGQPPVVQPQPQADPAQSANNVYQPADPYAGGQQPQQPVPDQFAQGVVSPQSPEASLNPAQVPSAATGGKKTKKLLLILGIVLLAIILAVGAYLIFGRSKHTNIGGINTTVNSSTNTKIASTKSAPIAGVTVTPTASTGYTPAGPITTSGISTISYTSSDVNSISISQAVYAWGGITTSSNGTNKAAVNNISEKLKQTLPNATVSVSGASPISVTGSDKKSYALTCNTVDINPGDGASIPDIFSEVCIAKLDSGKQFFEMTAVGTTASAASSLLTQFASGTTINFQ